MVDRLGPPVTFWIYAVLCIVTIFFVRSMVPETKQELLRADSRRMTGVRATAPPEISVVIPVYDNWWLTARCLRELERLRDAGAGFAFETIVVDNASRDETPRRDRRFRRGCAYHRSRKQPANLPARAMPAHAIARAPVSLCFSITMRIRSGTALTPLLPRSSDPEVAHRRGRPVFRGRNDASRGLAMLA